MLSRLRLARLYERLGFRSVAVYGGSMTMTMFKSHTRALQSLCFSLLVVLFIASESHAATCESLQALSLPNTTITLAQSVAAGVVFVTNPRPGRVPPPTAAFKQLPAFCRVAATLRPSTDSDIKIEVWMPLANWNGKFRLWAMADWRDSLRSRRREAGGMAWAWRGSQTWLRDSLHRYGPHGQHSGALLGHPEKLVDFAYRAVHEMTVTAKAIIRAFYDTNPKLSYWNGCSLGGRQGLIEAQRFPDDYDGIIAGAPAISQTRLVTWSTHVGQAALKEPQNMIPSSKYPMIHRAVMNACDAVDGTKDGLIDDPRRCRFDFKTIECKGERLRIVSDDRTGGTAQTITNPLLHPKTGETIFPGLALGTELGWGLRIGGPDAAVLRDRVLQVRLLQGSELGLADVRFGGSVRDR